MSVNGNNLTFKNGNGMYLSYHHNSYWNGDRYYNLSNQPANFMMTQYSTGLSIYYTSSNTNYYLTGINTKLEKINTEEDIDLIKIFLSELKQNLNSMNISLVFDFLATSLLYL